MVKYVKVTELIIDYWLVMLVSLARDFYIFQHAKDNSDSGAKTNVHIEILI